MDAKPSRILVDSLTAPINGLYGIEDEAGNINYYNSGTLFGAIDIALFIIVIGGFLGVTMKTGAIQAGIGSLVERMKGSERLMIPVLMGVFALGGPRTGWPRRSRLLRARDHGADRGRVRRSHRCGGRPARLRDRGPRVDGQPVRDGDRIGIAGVSISDGLLGRLVILIAGLAIGIFFVSRYAERVRKDPRNRSSTT